MTGKAAHRLLAFAAVALLLVITACGRSDEFIQPAIADTVTTHGAVVVNWETDFPAALERARAEGKPVLVNFYADWCVYCIQMERDTFPDPAVRDAMGRLVLLQADVTDNDDADQALQKHIGIPAPPAMIFWGADGKELRHLRLLGFMGPEEFAPHVREALKE